MDRIRDKLVAEGDCYELAIEDDHIKACERTSVTEPTAQDVAELVSHRDIEQRLRLSDLLRTAA
jgi:hypothetical protein